MRVTFLTLLLWPVLALAQFQHQASTYITIEPGNTVYEYLLGCSDSSMYFNAVPVQIHIKVVREAKEGENQLQLEPITFGTMLLADRRRSMRLVLPAMPADHYFVVVWADGYPPSWYHFIVQ